MQIFRSYYANVRRYLFSHRGSLVRHRLYKSELIEVRGSRFDLQVFVSILEVGSRLLNHLLPEEHVLSSKVGQFSGRIMYQGIHFISAPVSGCLLWRRAAITSI